MLSLAVLTFVTALHASINFQQVTACVTTWRKPQRRWSKKKKKAPHPNPALLKTPELDSISKIYSNSCDSSLAIHKKEPCFGRVCVCVRNICKDVKLLVLSFSIKGSSLLVNFSRGVQSSMETAPNEAIHLCWIFFPVCRLLGFCQVVAQVCLGISELCRNMLSLLIWEYQKRAWTLTQSSICPCTMPGNPKQKRKQPQNTKPKHKNNKTKNHSKKDKRTSSCWTVLLYPN